MSTFAASLPWFEFEVRRHLRGGRWVAGFVLFVGLLVAGKLWAQDPEARFGDGVMLAAIIALHFGFAEDRMSGFNLVHANHANPRAIFVQKTAAGLVLVVAFFLFAFTAAAVLWGDARLAAWYTCNTLLVLWLIVPFTLLIEMLIDVKAPAIVSLLIFTVALMFFVMRSRHGPAVTGFLGLEAKFGSFADLKRMLVVNATWNLLPLAAAYGVWSFRNRQRRIRPAA